MAVSNPASLSSIISEAAASGLGTYDSLYDFRRNGPVLGDSETTIGYGTEASPLKLSQFNGFEFVQYFWFSSAGHVSNQPIAVDQNGKIHVLTQDQSSTATAAQYTVTKNGVFEWGKEAPGAATSYDMAFDGVSAIYSSGITNSNNYGYIIKRDTSGNRGFFKIVEAVTSDIYTYPRVVASPSNVYVALDRTNTNTQSAAAAVKYNSSGTFQWIRVVSGEKIGISGVCLDSAENQYYVGYDYSGTGRGHMFKVNSSGTLQWQKLLSVTTGAPTSLLGCAYNNSESALYAVGNGDYIFKFDTNGNNVWQRKLAASGSFPEITVGDDGYIYAGGYASTVDPQKIYIVKLDTSGNLIWQRSWTVGTASSSEAAVPKKIIVKGGNLYFSAEHTGFVSKVGTFSTANIVKLPSDGSRTGSLWQATSYTWSTPTTVTLSNGSRTLSSVTPGINSDGTTADTSYTQTITKNSL